MGGDFGLRVSIPAAVSAISQFTDLDIFLVGDEPAIKSELTESDTQRFTIIHAPDVVLMSDKPSQALRKKKQSSMRIALDLLHSQQVDAVVSAGNTGALMAISCYVLKTLPGIDRPAICSVVPAANGHSYLLDLGANVDSCAEHLHQFAIMGSALAQAVDGVNEPRIALLNIGEEEIKGNEQVKLASKLIEADQQLNYVGFIEGDGIFSDKADVIVADGFVGNVALKVCEGTAGYISDVVQAEFKQNFLSRIAGFFAVSVLKRVYQKLDPQQYNGASLLGLQGVVVKSHGSSTQLGFVNAIGQARLEVTSNMLEVIDTQLAALSD
jgi:glycerol-3-phosphate acyltransferase PlsX